MPKGSSKKATKSDDDQVLAEAKRLAEEERRAKEQQALEQSSDNTANVSSRKDRRKQIQEAVERHKRGEALNTDPRLIAQKQHLAAFLEKNPEQASRAAAELTLKNAKRALHNLPGHCVLHDLPDDRDA